MSISHVFDTYAKTAQGRIIHFDVVLDEKNAAKALGYAKTWLESIGAYDAVVTQENCVFCHSAETPSELLKQIDSQGYAIYKLEGCPK
ncbi:DUF2024 family protein [Methylobacter sp. G7]|uniref:DUF2024 family protein n=1 Tax=Methylobacter sp. G7 TaxID=3230117 RepID=UPI003D809B15